MNVFSKFPVIRVAAVAVAAIVVTATLLVLVTNKVPGTETGGSDIAGIYFIKSDLERENSPQVSQQDLTDLINGNSSFAFDLYQKICGDSSNVFFSPYSISLALAMAHAGARGETEQQMAQALDFTLPQDRLHHAFNSLDLTLSDNSNENFILKIANSLWGQVDYPFNGNFLDVLALNYGARMWLVDFVSDTESSRQKINYWVSAHTENKINDLLPPGSIDPLTRLVLTNAIYFKASWLRQFEVGGTHSGAFTRLDNSQVTVQMMSQTEHFLYAEGTGYQAIELKYRKAQTGYSVSESDVSMFIILPTSNSFNEFESSLNPNSVASILENLQYREVALKIPKFEFEASLGLSDVLKQMGMTLAFAPGADFTGISEDDQLFIQDVLHKGFVSVDEEGTEAAAATAVSIVTSGISPPPTPMTIEHPFIFMIRHSNGSILFLGRVLDPTASA